MKFRSVQALGFGCLRNETLELAPGFNVVFGPNEAGKSTWHAAMYAALCGMRRGPGISKEDREFRERYRPWDGDDWRVKARVELRNGTEYDLLHDLDAKVACSVTDAATGKDVSNTVMFEGAPDGSMWLGLNRRLFLHVACIRQADILGILESANVLQEQLQRAVASPEAKATAAANMAEIMDGRFVLGLGTGTKRQNLYQVGQEFDHPASRLEAFCDVLRATWAAGPGKSLHISDRFQTLRFDDMALRRAHCDPPPPIYVAAVNDFMLRTAGRVADGLCGHMCFSAPYLREVVAPAIESGLADRGRDRSSFTYTSWVITSIDDDVRLARRRAAYQLAYYFSTKSYGTILEWHGFHGVMDRIRHALFEVNDWELAGDAISDEMIDTFAIAGTANDCREQLARYEGAMDEVVLYSHAAGPARADATANLWRILKAFG